MVRPFAGGGATPEHVNVITAADALALTHLSMPNLSGTAVAVLHEQAVEITALLIQIPGVAIHQVTPDAYEDDLRSEIVAGPDRHRQRNSKDDHEAGVLSGHDRSRSRPAGAEGDSRTCCHEDHRLSVVTLVEPTGQDTPMPLLCDLAVHCRPHRACAAR